MFTVVRSLSPRVFAIRVFEVLVVFPGATLMMMCLILAIDGNGISGRLLSAADSSIRAASSGHVIWRTCADPKPFETGLEPLRRPAPCATPVVESISLADAEARVSHSLRVGYLVLVVMGLLWLPIVHRGRSLWSQPAATPAE